VSNRSLGAQILVVPCPTCGADKNTPCKLISGHRRTQAHREGQRAASYKRLRDEARTKKSDVRWSCPQGRRSHLSLEELHPGWADFAYRRPGTIEDLG
jgi:hypothetical protein